MARMNIDGLEGVMADMARADAGLSARIDEALNAGAQVLTRALQDTAKSSFKRPTGELESLIKPGALAHYRSSAVIEVYPDGDYVGIRGKPRRAATVAFVLEYGRGGKRPMKANPWNKKAAKASEAAVNAIMREVLTRDP